MTEATREQLAAYAHEAWAAYMGYFLDKCEAQPDGALIIPAAYAIALRKQIATPYAELSESEKASDRDEADKMLAILGVRLMSSFTDREQTRKARTAPEERRSILLAVCVGVAVQSLELLIVIALLWGIFG